MAFGRKPQSMNQLLKDFMKKIPHQTELKRGMVLHLWPSVVGEKISNVSKDLKFDGSKLIIRVENEAWRHEIHANRFSIAKKLNEKVGSNVVKEIIVRA
jgi:predicted nucleic acid-binding Zn ribbon protein